MEHKEIKELVILHAYGELDGYSEELVKNHLSTCADCRDLLLKENSLRALMEKSLPALDERRLSDARLQLRAALRIETERKFSAEKFMNKVREFLYLNYKPILSGAVMLVVGFLLSLFVRINSSQSHDGVQGEVNLSELLKSGMKINNLRIISSDPRTGQMEIEFETFKNVRLNGSFNDNDIQSVMMYSILNDENPGVRLNSINIVDEKKDRGVDKDVKSALLSAAQYDENPGVRRSALKTLAGLPFDDDIKNALINIMSTDGNAAFRIEAINILIESQKAAPKIDETLQKALRQRAEYDENNYIRLKAKTVLQERSI